MFEQCKTIEEVKTLFRKLARYLHPDTGGDSYLMSRLQESKDYWIYKISIGQNYEKINEEQKKRKGKDFEKSFEDVFLGDSRLEVMKEIYKYAEKRKSFSTNFIDSVNEYLQEKGFITSAQYNTLVKCYYSFKMNVEE